MLIKNWIVAFSNDWNVITPSQLDFYVQRTIFSLSGGRLFSQEQLIDLSLIFFMSTDKKFRDDKQSSQSRQGKEEMLKVVY